MNRREFLTAIAAGGTIAPLSSPVGATDIGVQGLSSPHDGEDTFEREDWVPHHTLDINQNGITTLSISLEGPNTPTSVTLNSRRATVLEIVDGGDALSSGTNSYSWDVGRASSVTFRLQIGEKSGRGLKTAIFENSIASDLNEIVQVNQWPDGPDSLPAAYRFTFNTPADWSVVSPGKRVGDDTFDLNPGIIQYGSNLKDLFAVGEFDVKERDAGQTTIRYAKLPEADHDYTIEDAIDLLADTTPFIESIYGPNVHYPWAAIFVPGDFEHGGFIKDHSIFFGRDLALIGDGGSGFVHELGGLYNRAINCTSNRCSTWYIYTKGWVGRLYALYATDRIDHEELRHMLGAWLSGSNDARDHEDPLRVPASDAPVTKGSAITALLDMEIRARTKGEQDIGAWLGEISDQRILQYRGEDRALITDDEARPLLYEITGVDYTEFYERIVNGTEFPENFVEEKFSIENPWPIYAAFEYPSVKLTADEVGVDEPVEVTVEMRNDADRPQQRTVDLVVDGSGVAATDVQLDSGEATTVTFEHTFTTPGEYDVQVPPAFQETITVGQSILSPGQPGLGILSALAGVGGAIGYSVYRDDSED